MVAAGRLISSNIPSAFGCASNSVKLLAARGITRGRRPLSDLVEVKSRESTPEINHFDDLRCVTLDLQEGYGLRQVLNDVKTVASKMRWLWLFNNCKWWNAKLLERKQCTLPHLWTGHCRKADGKKNIIFFLIYSQIGLVTLIGLITKHGIFIVDFDNKLQEQGNTLGCDGSSTLAVTPHLNDYLCDGFGPFGACYMVQKLSQFYDVSKLVGSLRNEV